MADREEVLAFLEQNLPDGETPTDPLGEAIYTMNELGLWPEDVELTGELAMFVYNFVSFVNLFGWPKNLRM